MTKELEGYRLGKTASSKSTREKKARKITRVLKQHANLKKARVLEIGTGAGYIAHALSKEAKRVSSVDIVDDRRVKAGYDYALVDDESLPFKDNQFDIVITNHVLEHVPDQQKHISEIRRVLKDSGVVYLASPNKWWLTDPHYNLPFISWLPRPLASQYLAIVKRRKWDIYSVSLKRLRELAGDNGLELSNLAGDILTRPQNYDMSLPPLVGHIARRTPAPVMKTLLHIMPTHLVLLRPRTSKRRSP